MVGSLGILIFMSISLNDRNAFSSLRAPLSLASAAWSTLTNKVRRDGLAEFTRAMIRLCLAEQPFGAIARHREVVVFFEQPAMAPLRSMPFANKYLSGYLAKSLNKRARRDALLHHYRCIASRAAPGFLERTLTDSYLLWSKTNGEDSLAITLTFNSLSHYEGDLSVVFSSGDQKIFELSFAIVPGSAIGSSRPELLFIGRVQGVKDRFAEIKRATKACGDVAPQHMLVVTIQAIARALGITALADVTDEEQLANLPDKDFRFDYNAFWQNWVEHRAARGFYEIPIPLPQTALPEIESSHRRRTRKKREFKRQVAVDIAVRLNDVFPFASTPDGAAAGSQSSPLDQR